jgi:SAM-dependent methyltransferase
MSRPARFAGAIALATAIFAVAATAQTTPNYQPQVGQPGKDVVWVPTPEPLVERMLTMAQVTPNDFVVDLGSGDGRTVIMAAKRFGARAMGIEFNPDMVALSQRNAQKEGVSPERARLVRGDIFESDFSQATVVTMYLLPGLNLKLRPTLLKMKPGTRLVSHQFTMDDWQPDETSYLDFRPGYLWIVPAQVQGSWRAALSGGGNLDITLEQTYQKIKGSADFGQIKGGLREPNLRGDNISFSLVDQKGVLHDFAGKVAGDRMEGTFRAGTASGTWSATRRAG